MVIKMTNIMQFGMYKGLPAEVLPESDPGYCSWLLGHSWFRDNYPHLFSYFLRQGIRPMRRCTAILVSGDEAGKRCPKPATTDTYCRLHYRANEKKLLRFLEADFVSQNGTQDITNK